MGSVVEVAVRPGERPKVRERRFLVECLLCQQVMACPDEEDPWSWTKSQAVEEFLRDHRQRHGSDKAAGVRVELFEKDLICS